jgi:uncharacterized protein YecT (DUF1311 family)
MVRRDHLAELMERKKRSGRRGGRFPDIDDVQKLRQAWANCTDGPKELFASLLPARIATLTEVFCRYWVQKLIEHGSPYDERAIDLTINIKYDLPLVRNLHGQTISLGLLISNNVSLSNIETISATFSILLKTDFWQWLSKARYRVLLESEPDGGGPIIKDLDKLKRTFARIFEVRHILVHEFPEKSPFAISEIDEMIFVADLFIRAASEAFSQLLYGLWPITQHDMNKVACDESKAAEAELEKLIAEVATKQGSNSIIKVQKAWRAFAEAEAERNAEWFTGGSMHPMLYNTALKDLTSDRISQLRNWLEEQPPEE